MPQVGELTRSKDIGKTSGYRYIYLACSNCGRERWVRLEHSRRLTFSGLCSGCSAGKRHPHWTGGRHNAKRGYIVITLTPDNFFYPMVQSSSGRVYEHRLVMAKYLGRCLHQWELVHHKNGIKDDNRIENLQLITDDRHKQITVLEQEIARLKARVTLLEANNAVLEVKLNTPTVGGKEE